MKARALLAATALLALAPLAAVHPNAGRLLPVAAVGALAVAGLSFAAVGRPASGMAADVAVLGVGAFCALSLVAVVVAKQSSDTRGGGATLAMAMPHRRAAAAPRAPVALPAPAPSLRAPAAPRPAPATPEPVPPPAAPSAPAPVPASTVSAPVAAPVRPRAPAPRPARAAPRAPTRPRPVRRPAPAPAIGTSAQVAVRAYGDRCDAPGTVTLADLGGVRYVYEPADAGHAAAVRECDPAAAASDQQTAPMPHCPPTPQQDAFARHLAQATQQALQRYVGRPDLALQAGFRMLPLPDSRWSLWIDVKRIDDGDVLDPAAVEAFMAAMTDRGWYPVGAMYMTPDKGASPPNPTGCLLQWRRDESLAGLTANAQAAPARLLAGTSPDTGSSTVWMARVWTYGGLDPWGRDYRGTEPETWFGPYRPLPAFCSDTRCI